MPLRILALHGFLGAPSDWDSAREAGCGLGIDAVRLDPAPSLGEWADRFCAGVEGRPVLLGYSMGARLAMHAILRKPELFRGAILVSGNPGLASVEARQARLRADEEWARRFEFEDWEAVMKDWNAQPVFSGEELARDPSRRSEAVRALRAWSLGRQENLIAALESVRMPLLWVAGERDSKFVGILQALRLGRQAPAAAWIAPGAGHRVPWETQKAFWAKVAEWVGRL